MTTTTYTSGTWAISRHATPDYAPQYGIYANDASGWDIATVHGENAASNAVLIAAAPQLLAVLEEMLQDAETLKEPYRNEAICERARAVIAEVNLLQL